MYLVEEHIISKQHSLYGECDRLSFASKNLYNFSLYKIKEYQEKNNNYIPSGYDLYHIIKNEQCFKALPNDTAKQTVFQAVNAWKYFYKSLKAWKKTKSTTGCPKPPKYKHKIKGRDLVTIPIRDCRLKNNKILFNKNLNLRLKTKVDNLVQVQIIPQSNCYKIQISYKQIEKEKVTSNNKIAIDLGVNNFCTISNNFNSKPIIINGKPIKSINQYYNKKQAKLQSQLKGRKHWSNKLSVLTNKRNNKIKWTLHNYSKFLINYCIQNNVSQIAIGYNEQWKRDINIGKVNNQKFTYIPYKTFIDQVKYKAELNGITVLLNEESYTSKTSAYDREEPIKQQNYLGERIKRGLFKTLTGLLINSDLNGSIQIGYKVFGNSFRESNIGCVVHPLKVTPL